LGIDRHHPHVREHLAAAYLMKGDTEQYMTENVKHAEPHNAPRELVDDLKRVFAEGGYHGMIRSVLQRAQRQPGAIPAMQLALFYGVLGELDAAFPHLSRAIDEHDPSLVYLAVGPQWDCLRRDPRFDACLNRMGLECHISGRESTPP